LPICPRLHIEDGISAHFLTCRNAAGRRLAESFYSRGTVRDGRIDKTGVDMRKIWIAALGSGFIAACGGGGDGDSTPAASIAITAANQDAVAGAAAGAVAAISGAGGGFSLPSGASAATATRAFAAHLATTGRKQAAAAGRAGAHAVPPETVPCSVSGTATLSVVDADNDGTPSVGDRLTMSFDQCKETATDTIDGSMAVRLDEISFENDRLSFTGSSTIDDLVVTEGTRRARMDGSLAMSYV
jgi:hypothetical protein